MLSYEFASPVNLISLFVHLLPVFCRELGEERGFRRRTVYLPQHVVGRPYPTRHRGRPLAIAGLDGGVPEGGEVHRLRPFLGAARQTGHRAGGRKRERDRAGGEDDHRQDLQAVVLRRGRQQLL